MAGYVDEHLADALDDILAVEGLSRAAWVRALVTDYVATNSTALSKLAQGDLLAS